MAIKYHRKFSIFHIQIPSRRLLLEKPPHREANAQEVYQNSLRTEAKARVVYGTGSELDQALDSLQVMKTQMMRIAYASQGHQPPEDNGPNQVYINCELMLPGRFVQ
ncbi:unnamed protein product [Brassica oleracea var. botrytis]|nr:unnamed protein product [Brassica napus]